MKIEDAFDKERLLEAIVPDLVADLLYYGRKEDEDLPLSVMEKAIEERAFTIEEVVDAFEKELRKHL
jgi:hypothetical protein